jgi:dihydrofolate synthase/folylpolyglutamate synthase
LEDAAERIADVTRKLVFSLTPPRYLGPGGAILALAATIFADNDVSVVIVESGRGGEFDESSLIDPTVTVITPIMREHPDKLGSTVEAIAETKARIAAPGSTIVCAPQSEEVMRVIERVAAERACDVERVDIETTIFGSVSDIHGTTSDIRVGNDVYSGLRTTLLGPHQTQNLATALLAGRAIHRHGATWTRAGIYEGARRLVWPGRLQLLQRKPWVLLDAAINGESARFACEITRLFPSDRMVAVVSIPVPKDIEGVCREVSRVAGTVITCNVPSPALSWYPNAAEIASRYAENVVHFDEPEPAFAAALERAGPAGGVLLLGTISFLTAALKYWDRDACALWPRPGSEPT